MDENTLGLIWEFELKYDETTALGPAVLHLLKSDEKYISTAIEYLLVIDFEHDVFCKENILEALYNYHSTHGEFIKTKFEELDNTDIWLSDYLEFVNYMENKKD